VKTYRGYTDTDETVGGPSGPALVYAEGRAPYPLRHLIVHSPSGMAWGYGGSGAADLALAVLADYLGEAEAIPAHERYSHPVARPRRRRGLCAILDPAGEFRQPSAYSVHDPF